MRRTVTAGLGALMLFGSAVVAEEFEVRMLNRGAEGIMVFEPSFLQIAPGDSVRFVPTDRSHNAESVRGMTPDGAEPFKGRINEEITVTFDVEGAYGYMCAPHFVMGMVGLIVVGEDPQNIGDFAEVRMSPRARERFDAYIAQIDG